MITSKAKKTTGKAVKKVKKSKKIEELKEKIISPNIEIVPEEKSDKFFEAIGRRKTAIARVRLFAKGDKEFLINAKPYNIYFPYPYFQKVIQGPLEVVNCPERFKILAKVKGGGSNSQAEAIRHGLSRALVLFNSTLKKKLRKAGFLTRDPRMRERKKFGLKRARRAPQWQKR